MSCVLRNSKLGVKTWPCLLQLRRNCISRRYLTSTPTHSPSSSAPSPLASPGLSALDSVVFPSVFPFKVIAEHSPPLTVEILQKAKELLLLLPRADAAADTETENKTEANARAEAETEAMPAATVPHTVTLKGRYMSLTLLPVLQHASQVHAVYGMLHSVKEGDPMQRIKLVL